MAHGNSYAIGATVRLAGDFEGEDPQSVVAKVRPPGDVTQTYTYGEGPVVKLGIGIYQLDVAVDRPGVWYYRFEGAGTVQGAAEGQFSVGETEL